MAGLAVDLEELHEPNVHEIAAARIAARQFSKLDHGGPVSFVPEAADTDDTQVEPITIPASALRTIIKMLIEIGNGNAIAVVPIGADLTTQQAAELLNVSRPHLIKLLEQERLPHRMVGTHRKLAARDVLDYREKVAMARRAALTEMVELDRELGLDEAAAAGNDGSGDA